jgi:GTP:adenosylcobinamide-phosphate guanylyltransferase
MSVIDAAVMAGGVPAPGEPLWAYTRGRPKALLPIAGRPMVQWVLDAVGSAPSIRNVVLVGVGPDAPPLQCPKPLRHIASSGSLVDAVQAASASVRADPSPPDYLLTIGADIPSVTPAIVEWATTMARGRDAYGFVVSLATLARRFPGRHGDLLRLVDGFVVLADLALFKPSALTSVHPAWSRLVAARKSVLTMALLVGPATLFRLLLRRLRLADIERIVRTRLDLDAEAVVCPFAEAAMDADVPEEYDMLLRDFANRTRAT